MTFEFNADGSIRDQDLVGRNAKGGSAERFAIRRIALTGIRPTDLSYRGTRCQKSRTMQRCVALTPAKVPQNQNPLFASQR